MKKSNGTTTVARLRVGIYCRQSVANELEFGSIEAQREAVEAYVASQRAEGWVALPDRYDDAGFSGGTVERPAFQRLMTDILAGKVDVVAIYKLDRLSRSLLDFSQIVDSLQKHGVALVSVTQQFNTASSMGKLTLNILMSFAEFERQVISERTKDKLLATRKRGQWTGGRPVLGFDVRDKALVVNATEAKIVCTIFESYLECGGLVTTLAELQRRSIRNKTWTNQDGKQVRGCPFDKGSLRNLLGNPLYVGKVRCGSEVVNGKHEAIVDAVLFDEVQRALQDHRHCLRVTPGKWGAILSGLLKCGRCGAAMTHAANVRGNRTHRYYCCVTLQKQGAGACPGSRAPAAEIEDVVLSRIRAIGQDPDVLLATFAAAREAKIAQEPELIAEARRIAIDRTDLAGQRKNLLDALAGGGVATNAIASRIGEVDQQLAGLQARHDELTAELAALQTNGVDEPDVRESLKEFLPVWDRLIPRERARVLRLLIEEIRYDGQAGEIEIRFRDNGLRSLRHEVQARRPA